MPAAISIEFPRDRVNALCKKWNVLELSLFGSVVRDELCEDSDVDLLVTFDNGAPWSSWDLLEMRDELKEIFGREIDLVEERSLKNPFRRASILRSKQVIYAAD